MDSACTIPKKKYYLEFHKSHVSVVNVENFVKSTLKISYTEELNLTKEKEYIDKNILDENEDEEDNRFWFFGCLGIIKADNINFLVIVSDAEIVSYLFNHAIYRIKKISFIQLNKGEINKNGSENYEYEICRLWNSGRLTRVYKSTKGINCSSNYNGYYTKRNNKIAPSMDDSFNNAANQNGIFMDNPVSGYNNESYIHKFKNSNLKRGILDTLNYFFSAFNKGPFYFSYYYNLTVSLQTNYIYESKNGNNIDTKIKTMAKNYMNNNDTKCKEVLVFEKLHFDEINPEYAWNWKILDSFIKVNGYAFVIFPIHGYVNSIAMEIEKGGSKTDGDINKVHLLLISRKNKNRGGVRFWCRGGNEKGEVANFVETEQVVICKDLTNTHIFSYIIIRGSIPVLWSQEPGLSLRPKINICFDMTKNIKTINLHMQKLKNKYGKIHITNLINRGYKEKYLGEHFEKCLKECNVDHSYIWFDFNSELKNLNYEKFQGSLKSIINDLTNYSYFFITIPNDKKYNLEHGGVHKSWSSIKFNNFQNGVFRVNCVDCLDRTNVFQSFLSKCVLFLQLKNININIDQKNNFPFYFFKNKYHEMLYRKNWINNANAISIIYSGSGALKNDITQNGKRTICGLFQDLCNAISRYINNNFRDGYNNDCINIITNENIHLHNLFNKKVKYNQILNVIFEFIVIFSTSVCTNPIQNFLRRLYFFSHSITHSTISQGINYMLLILNKNPHLFIFPFKQVQYIRLISIISQASGFFFTSFFVFLFFCFYVFTQRRRVISFPKFESQ
ncbi:inositol-polyphosphate 5-phosphatase, putative [Plasmodium chabaudi adami]|uniref:Inositol-polyphosphate 5-phosphatase, putative n=1 Tax=Plasmodium chabaudi adami TaxID=5826 RepID=A0A1D3RYS8_PLACE|nr:inositol-polyphosphate 5-phosphatase, putative [Plasmodium chabaudi adami]